MEKHILSKTTYIKGVQCMKQLYLTKKYPKLRDRLPAERLAIFSRGTNVGIYAQDLFPGGIDAGPKHYTQYQKAVARTKELMENGQEVIYEAAFQANRTLILLDILLRNGDKWDAYEVKSSVKLSRTYYNDAALQYNVIVNSGIALNSFSLIYINKDYKLDGDINIQKLFIITDVTQDCIKQQSFVKDKIGEELLMLNQDEPPIIGIGKQCFEPYDCDFIGHCWKGIKRPSVFDIPSIDISRQFVLYNKYGGLPNILQNEKSIDEFETIEMNCQIEKMPHLDLSEDTLNDFEELYNSENQKYAVKILYFTPALPLYSGTKPYQKIAFAYSLMPLDGSGNVELFIANGQNNPNEEIFDRLLNDSKNIDLLGYNINTNYIEVLDLQQIVDNGEYYHPAMNTDYSNKLLSKAMDIRPQWGAIESDIVAAQYYDEILRGHKKSKEKLSLIKNYLQKEVELVGKFFDYLSQ